MLILQKDSVCPAFSQLVGREGLGIWEPLNLPQARPSYYTQVDFFPPITYTTKIMTFVCDSLMVFFFYKISPIFRIP